MQIKQHIFRFTHPFTALISGASGSGKTVLTRNLLKEYKVTTTISSPRLSVLWCHGQWQSIYETNLDGVDIKYHDGLADETTIRKNKPDVVVIDDLMNQVVNEKGMSDLFTKKSHHLNISVIFIVQNIFKKGSEMRDIRLNSHQIILLKNPQDALQVQMMGRQIFPGDSKVFNEVFRDATRKPYTYLNIDCSPQCPDKFRLKSRLTKTERGGKPYSPIVYIPQKI